MAARDPVDPQGRSWTAGEMQGQPENQTIRAPLNGEPWPT